jgi:hypothetical protein
VLVGYSVHHVFVLLLAGLVDAGCRRQPVAGGCLAWAWG